jgi:hypothetical protein
VSPQQAAARPLPAAPAPLRHPPGPRRVSGPVRHPRAVPRPASPRSPIVRLLDAPFLDRLIRGRIWIGLVAVALLGIVAMQVAILQLGTSIGASTQQIERLTQANETATTAIAQDEPGSDVATEAAKLGMVYPPPADVDYLTFHQGIAAQAATTYTLPTAPPATPLDPGLTTPIVPTTTQAPTDTTPATTTYPTTTSDPATASPSGAATAPTSTQSTTTPSTTTAPSTTQAAAGGGASAP